MNMQMSELMISSPHNFPCILHVKACPYIKIYQNKHYSAFIKSGYKASNFTLS